MSKVLISLGYTPLLLAIERWLPDVVDKLLELGADITAIHSKEGDNAFGFVAKNGLHMYDIAKVLIKRIQDIDFAFGPHPINHINEKHEGFVSLKVYEGWALQRVQL